MAIKNIQREDVPPEGQSGRQGGMDQEGIPRSPEALPKTLWQLN